jgi:hypothetical protein
MRVQARLVVRRSDRVFRLLSNHALRQSLTSAEGLAKALTHGRREMISHLTSLISGCRSRGVLIAGLGILSLASSALAIPLLEVDSDTTEPGGGVFLYMTGFVPGGRT